MRPIISEIFNKRVGGSEKVKLSDEYSFLITKANKLEEILLEKLSKDCIKDFNNFREALQQAQSEEVDCNYIDGYKLGVIVGLEVAEILYK